MFTLEQIKAAHSKVKSGADFPKYIQDLKQLGVVYYETYVADGHTDYYDLKGSKISSPIREDNLEVSTRSNASQFINDLKAHQQGKTDYPTFCKNCAQSGIEKWIVRIDKMTCTYYDKAQKEILVEQIPQ